MKCFHFTSGEDDGDFLSRKLSWARSLSVASTSSNSDTRRLREYHKGGDSSDSSLIAAQVRRANDLRAFRLSELKSATRGFSRALVVGEGGFGCVYKGRVKLLGSDNEFDVAVKQLNRNGFQGHKEWINEVNYLGVVKHPNLVKLIGYCAADDERGIQRLLVYEFLQNKSLEDHLLTQSTRPLPWIVRLKIARDAARGLAYLHEDMEFQLIFRDFKASNILLDEDFNAKLSDFGLARQGPASGLDHVSTSVVGTVGYAAPEYVHTGRLTTKSDVWSFGVVLYEIITGRRVLERNLPRGEQKLLEWVRPYVSDSKRFHLILDPRLEEGHNNGVVKSAQKLAFLANKCLMKHPRLRPKMSQVIEMLECIISELAENPFACCVVVERVNDEDNDDDERESDKAGNDNNDNNSNNRRGKNGFDFRDLVSRNRSLGRLDWRNWTLGFVRT